LSRVSELQVPFGAVYFRKSNPPRDDWERDYGVAAADGLSFGWSPMIGAGSQAESDGGIAAFRFEIQIFTRGGAAETYDRARLVVGAAIGIP